MCFVSFTVRFGPSGGQAFRKIKFSEFVNKHVLQLPEGQLGSTLSSNSVNDASAQVPSGLIRGEDGEERKGTQSNPWLVLPEFEFVQNHIFPASESSLRISESPKAIYQIDSGWRAENTSITDPIQMAPCGIDTEIETEVSMTITKADGLSFDVEDKGISNVILTSFPETIWRCKLDGNNNPEPITSPGRDTNFISGSSTLFRAISNPEGWENTMLMDQVTESRFIHNLPFIRFIDGRMPEIDRKELEPDHDFIIVEKLERMKEQYTNPVKPDDILSLYENPDVLQHNKNVLTNRAKMTNTTPRMNSHAAAMQNQNIDQVNTGGRI